MPVELTWDGKYVNGKKTAPVRIALPFQDVETVNESVHERTLMLDLWGTQRQTEWRNRLIWGDKKYVLPSLLPEFAGKVNLIYIDPPFATGADFSFTATIPNDNEDGIAGGASFVKQPSVIEQKAYRDTWGRGLDSYLQWFYETAVLLHELLSEDGSIYVHLDEHVSHYAKVVLDEVFGTGNFKNELVWKSTSAHSDSQRYGSNHEIILFFAKGEKWTWNKPMMEYDEQYIEQYYRYKEDSGRRFKSGDLSAFGLHGGGYTYEWHGHTKPWRVPIETMRRLDKEGKVFYTKNGVARLKSYLDEAEGIPAQTIWADKAVQYVVSWGDEKLTYATQKSEGLLKRIIQASSNEGDLVLDCFCVRKGTLIWAVPQTPLNPPAHGGRETKTGNPETEVAPLSASSLTPSPYTGRAGEGSSAQVATQTLLNPPAYGEKETKTGNPETEVAPLSASSPAPSPYTGRGGEGSSAQVATQTPLNPPAHGGREPKTGNPETEVAPLSASSPAPSPYTGRGGVGSHLTPIENLRPGDLVLSHDGQPHRVIRTVSRPYRGRMIGIRCEGQPDILWTTPEHRILTPRRVNTLSQAGRWSEVPPAHFERARELRREMTPPERRLWAMLRHSQLDIKFRRQHPIGPYIADFYARQAGLVVEVDGKEAHSGADAQAYDAARNQYMHDLGLQVIRFPATDIMRHPDGVWERIQYHSLEHVLDDQPDKQWRYAEHLCAGDIVYTGPDLEPQRIAEVIVEHSVEEVYDIEVEGVHSYLTEVCVVHNCGSGTTAAVAEKLGRRWITADLGRFAIHTARKRLLAIPDVKPFVVQNLGKYERQAWAGAEFGADQDRAAQAQARYRRFILDLYGARPLDGYAWLHGVRAGHLVHVGSVDAPILVGDVRAIAQEFWKAVGKNSGAQTNTVDVLGWDFAFEINELGKQLAADANIKMAFKRIPREVLEKKAVEQGDIRFFELAALGVEVQTNAKRGVSVTLTDFVVPPDDVPADVQAAISHWSQWVDYWAIDWDHKGDTFHNQWQSYRAKKDPKLQLTKTHTYDAPGHYTIVIKVIDILGNDTTKSLQVEVK